MFVSYYDPATMAQRVALTAAYGENDAGGSISRVGYFTQPLIKAPYIYVGMPANKMGRSTGWTRGEVTQTCVDRLLARGADTVVVLCSFTIGGAAVGTGDSGAPIFATEQQGNQYGMGILFGGGPYTETDNTSDVSYDYCVPYCQIYFSSWDNIQWHLARYFILQ